MLDSLLPTLGLAAAAALLYGLLRRQAGYPVQQRTDEKLLTLVLPKDLEHHLADDLAVPEICLPRRHADERKVQLVAKFQKPAVDLWDYDAHIVQNQPH